MVDPKSYFLLASPMRVFAMALQKAASNFDGSFISFTAVTKRFDKNLILANALKNAWGFFKPSRRRVMQQQSMRRTRTRMCWFKIHLESPQRLCWNVPLSDFAGWWPIFPASLLVGGIPTPPKNMSSSVGMTWHSQYDGKVIKFHGSSHHQAV